MSGLRWTWFAAGTVIGAANFVACAPPVVEEIETNAAAQYAGELVSDDRIAALAKEAGLPCSAVVTATAVALGESEGYAGATHANVDGSVDRGLWQINSTAWPMYSQSCVFDPACNAGAMAAISGRGASWQPWLAFTNGRYQQFLARAQAAYGRLAACGGTGGGGGGGGGTARCDELGYDGKCFGGLSVWAEPGRCRIRDCAAEGKTCGHISDEAGNGCLGGTSGARASDCSALGYDGKCFGSTLVWAERDGTCRVVECAKRGQRCGADGANGQNCL